MKVICYVCKESLGTHIDEYISICEPDGNFVNDSKSLRRHFKCKEK